MTGRPAVPVPPRGRGFTLLEVLLALGLLVVALSLVGPALLGRIAPMTFEKSARSVESALRLAREEARRSGATRFVYAEREGERGAVSLVLRADPVEGSGETGGPSEGDAEGERPLRILMVLPAKFALTDERPAVLRDLPEGEVPSGQGAFDDAVEERDGPRDEPASAAPRLVLACLPDGSVVSPRRLWLTDPGGRAASLRVDPSLGLIRVVAEPAAAGSGEVGVAAVGVWPAEAGEEVP